MHEEITYFMKIYTALSLAALLTGLGTAGAHAQGSIYVYNFNDGVAGNSAANTANLFSVDRANQGATLGGSSLSSNFDPTTITSFGGSTVNADNGDVAGQDLGLQGGANNANNGQFLTATANLTGFQNIGFSFAGRRSGSGFSNDTLAYSLDGGSTFTTFASAINLPLAYAAQTYDFSSIGGLNNNANAQFRLTFDGATSANGNNRFDNLVISGSQIPMTAPVPEASTTISLGLMLALGGLAFAVKKKKASVSL